MKKVLKMALASLMAVTTLTACSQPAEEENPGTETPTEEKISIGFVTDMGGINDHSFNETSYKGIQDYAAEAGLVEGTDYSYLQSDSETDYMPNLSTYAEEGVDLIAAAGFLFADAITEAAQAYPDQKMLIIDVDSLDPALTPNVQQAVFAEHEGSYLVGVVAGLRAKNEGYDAVGFVMGQESVTMEKFWAGYQQGVWSVYPECQIYYDNANNFAAPEVGKSLAGKQYNSGAYIIFHAAGATGNGVISEAQERAMNGEDVWVIGVDTDQYAQGYVDEAQTKSIILTSMMKRVDTASYNAAKAVAEGTFEGGVVRYTLADNGVGLPEENPNLTEEELAAVEEATQKIVSGEVVVSETAVNNDLTIGD